MKNELNDKQFHTFPALNNDEIARYSRHIMISQVGEEGQRKLKNSQVLLVGVGGLGSPEALYLAAAGIGRIGIIDHDVVDSSNLQRQIIHSTPSIQQKKVESARRRMVELNPYIQVDVFPDSFHMDNSEEISADFDIILDGTDNLASRYLINDICFFSKKPYIYGSVFEFEGQASVFDARYGPCYRCMYPAQIKTNQFKKDKEQTTGVFGVLPGTIGTIQATETIKIILGIGNSLIGTLLYYDALDMTFQRIQIKKNPECQLCSSKAQIHSLKNGAPDYPN